MPAYPHYAHLPYAHQPWKTLYLIQCTLSTLALVPYWVLKYAILPKRYRPRPSWSLIQLINVYFIRRIYTVTELAGFTWQTRDPQSAPDDRCLEHSRFQWIEPLPADLRTGVVVSNVPFCRVGAYIYPKEFPPKLRSNENNDSLGEGAVIGLFMHGGGYCHMSAHESSRPSRIPKRLIKDCIVDEIFSVEYRLLQHAHFPAVVQDTAAVYVHVLNKYRNIKCKIILVGDSSGGHLVLALTRWIRDEGVLQMPHGLLLLSPSCDLSNALPETLPYHPTRPNSHTDFLPDTPKPRALLHRTFLGLKYDREECIPEKLKEIVHSEYISPCSPVVLKRWGHEVNLETTGERQEQFQQVTKDNLEMDTATDIRDGDAHTDYNMRGSLKFPTLFYGFPKTQIVVGDAERLTHEIDNLIQAMKKEGVDVEAEWVPDAVHDILIMNEWTWDKKVINRCWADIAVWARAFRD